MSFNLYYNIASKQISIVDSTRTAPSGSTLVGPLVHDDEADPLGPSVNHVLYHHIRDLLYPLGIWDLGSFNFVKIDAAGIPVLIFNGTRTWPESASVGTIVGTLSVDNPDGTYTISKTADPNSKFTLEGSDIKIAAPFDFETATVHTATFSATNGEDTPITYDLSVSVTNILEGNLAPTTFTADQSAPVGTTLFTVTGFDVGANEAIASVSTSLGSVSFTGAAVKVGSTGILAGSMDVLVTTTAGRSFHAIGTITNTIAPMHISDYTTAPTIGVSMRLANPSFAGKCIQVRGDVNTATADIDFGTPRAKDVLISDTALQARITAGDTEHRGQRWYNQWGADYLASTSSTTGLVCKQAASNANNPGKPSMKSKANANGLTTNTAAATGVFNVGGAGDAFTFMAVYTVTGWGAVSFGTTTPSSISNNGGTLLGFGSSTTEYLSLAETDNVLSSEPNYGGTCVLRDDINMLFERSTTWGRTRAIAIKFDGLKISGFLNGVKMFEYTVSAAQMPELDNVRLWLGSSSGPGNAANCDLYESFIWATHLVPDDKIIAIQKEQVTFWNAGAAVDTNDVVITLIAQSNGGTFSTYGWDTFRNGIKTINGMNAMCHQMPIGYTNLVAFGGSAIQKACCATSSPNNYWREPNLSSGPNSETAKTAIASSPLKNVETYGLIIIGEQESVGLQMGASTYNGTVGDPLYNTATKEGYKNGLLAQIADYEAAMGHPVQAWVICGLHLQAGYSEGFEKTRQAQIELANANPGKIYFINAAADATMTDDVHWDSPSWVNKIAPRLARRMAKIIRPSMNLQYEGARITEFRFNNAERTEVKFTITHAENGGTDWGPADTLVNAMDTVPWYVESNGVRNTVQSVAKIDATHGKLVFAAPLSAVNPKAQWYYGGAYNAAKMLVDNSTLPFPIMAGQIMNILPFAG